MKCICIVFLLIHFVCGNEEDFRIIDSVVQERPCIQAGGLCTVKVDCPKGHLSEQPGLCPSQKKKGIECCHGVSIKETRCDKHGGICIKPEEFCNPSLIFDEASDCGSDKCCILVL